MSAASPDTLLRAAIGDDVTVACPACGASSLRVIERQTAIPVHNTLMLDDATTAVAFATGDLVLGWCGACGFAANVVFDESKLDYSSSYEESQGFSGTFNAFARGLAKEWIDRFDVREGDVVEIGCGKGDFLKLMVELGNNRGLGFDPAFDPARVDTPERGSLEVRQERFDHSTGPLDVDFVCCRHTLEHIDRVHDFVTTVRAAIPAGRRTALGFELPDFERILDEGAFWDVYYEHCSYFTRGSLRRLFERSGFEVHDVRLVYGNQYLILEATPGKATDGQTDDLPALAEKVDAFPDRVRTKVESWRRDLAAWKAEGLTTVLWGSGSKAVGFLTAVGDHDAVTSVVDINPHKQGRFMPGCPQPIVGPEDLKTIRPDVVVVMNPIYLDEIGADLRSMDLEPRLTALT